MSCRKSTVIATTALTLLVSPVSFAAVDYARDIQPLFEKHCYECHGPKKQKNGFRLDRRSRAFQGVMRANILPGSSAGSRVYRRVVDSQFGLQMPPEEVLAPEQIGLIRQWIDEGAHWPDELANEVEPPPPDPAALAMIERILGARNGGEQRRQLVESFAGESQALNARGPDGATPLMYVALHGDADMLRAALAAGGNPNHANDAGATALIWAVQDAEKVRLLLEAGANPNVASVFGRTPLWLAALSRNDSTLDLLLARGAEPSPQALLSSTFGDQSTMRRLVKAGAKDKGESAGFALRNGCMECLEFLLPDSKAKMPRALTMLVPPSGVGNPVLIRAALDRGADVNARDNKGRTVLIALAISEQVTPELVQEIIDRGAEVNARALDGQTALDHARKLGRQPIIDVLERAGAKATSSPTVPAQFLTGNTARAAITRSLPLLQKTSKQFYDRGGCVGCHHNLQLAFTLREAKRAGFGFDPVLAREELETLSRDIEHTREQALEGIVAPGGAATTIGYILTALEAQDFPANESTDSLARLLRLLQRGDGRWLTPMRPPIEYSEFTAAAVSLQGLRAYGRDDPAASHASIERAVRWLENTKPLNHEDRVFRLFGLVWGNGSQAARDAAVRELQKQQRRDGGWAQTDFRASDAYATGEALVALRAAGVSANSKFYRRGIRYLLGTQLEDGSWFVASRSHPTQAFFDSGFPHGADQYISSAATHWATLALLQSMPDTRLASVHQGVLRQQ